ncbi:EAL domain-containing protein [Viridibacillus arvi]|uniref:EAL domain-containing protein n=1 Tax=Viridibacillus arvi TaxID=263475 RepID=UPI0034CF4885
MNFFVQNQKEKESYIVLDEYRKEILDAIEKTKMATLFTFSISNFKRLAIRKGFENTHISIMRVIKEMKKTFHGQAQLYQTDSSEYILLFPKRLVEPIEIGKQIHNLFAKQLSSLVIDIGYAISEQSSNAEQLLNDSYMAMTMNNQSNAFAHGFTEQGKSNFSKQLVIENELEKAINKGELSVVYQPIVSTNDLDFGFEALVRWESGLLGNVPPLDFIHIAEKSGLILDVTTFVVETVLVQLQEHPEIPYINVNLSAALMDNSDWFDGLLEMIHKVYVSEAQRLSFEITEGIMLKEEHHVTIHKLRDLGHAVYIDDFGTGYSSMSYLIDSPFTGLKIDRDFINLLGTQYEPVVKNMISLAQHLNLSVVAEGVETDSQLSSLKEMSCDFIQGYLEAAPLTRLEMNHYLLSKGEPASCS